MVLTYEQRIALLAKAREAKKTKKEQADALKPVPVKGRPKKVTNKNVTLDLVDASATPPAPADVDDSLEIKDEEIKDMIKPSEEEIKEIKKIENTGNYSKRTSKKKQSQIKTSSHYEEIEPEIEPEIIEEVEIRKVKKPKKRIIRKIIKEQYDSESTEEEYEEVVYQAPKRSQKERIQQVTKTLQPPKEPEIKTNISSGFNLFSY